MNKFLYPAITLFILFSCSCEMSSSPDIYTLTTGTTPADGGSVTPSEGEFEDGTEVTLKAEPAVGYLFVRWTNDYSGSDNPTSVIFNNDKNLTAVFEPREYPLNIDTRGEGTVDEEVVQQKARDYEHGTTVRLTANPAEGWSFTQWEGDLDGSVNPETITIEEESKISAVFSEDDDTVFVSTTAVSDVTATSAVSGGTISSNGQVSVTARGVCSSTTSSPDMNDACTDDGSGTGSFTSSLSDLNPATTYYARAFATTDQETTYGDELTFTTVEQKELVIMPLGNSMTNDSRSRVKLWNLLIDDGYEIDYVGDQHQTSSIPDPDHEGVGGIVIQEVIDKAASLMDRHEPEYVTLMIGTNDIAWYFDEPAADIADRWNELVQLLLDHTSSDTYIIAATIPPVTSKQSGSEDMEERDRAVMVSEFNQLLRELIETRRQNGDNIVLADMEEALDPNQHLASDGVHLNEEGYAIMGTVYYEALTAVLSGGGE